MQGVDQDKVEGRRGGGGQTNLQCKQNKSWEQGKTWRQILPAVRPQTAPEVGATISYLKVLVVVRVNTKTWDEAVHHELHISVLTACAPQEGFGWVEQQSLQKQQINKVNLLYRVDQVQHCNISGWIKLRFTTGSFWPENYRRWSNSTLDLSDLPK